MYSNLSSDNQNNVLSTLHRLPIDNFYLLRQLAHFERMFPIVRNSSFGEIANALAEARETIMYAEMYADEPKLQEDIAFIESLRRIRNPRLLVPTPGIPFLNQIMIWAILHGAIRLNNAAVGPRRNPFSSLSSD
jgi:hypothetical protein